MIIWTSRTTDSAYRIHNYLIINSRTQDGQLILCNSKGGNGTVYLKEQDYNSRAQVPYISVRIGKILPIYLIDSLSGKKSRFSNGSKMLYLFATPGGSLKLLTKQNPLRRHE